MKDIADDLALIVRNAIDYINKLEQQINELKRKPVQEPVAWLFTNLQSGDYDFCYQEDEHDHDREMWHKQPLYTTPPQQALTIERLRDALVASRIIPPAAVEDPDEYDDGVTLFRIEALHRRIT